MIRTRSLPILRHLVRAVISTLVVTGLTAIAVAVDGPEGAPTTLAEAVAANPELSEFAHLLEASGVIDVLAAPGRITLFAPTNEALEELGEEAIEALQRDRGVLDVVVRHHVTLGASPLHALRRLDAITTLENTRLIVRDDGNVVRVGGVRIVGEPIVVEGGVLYVVDRLLLPDASLMRKDLLAGPPSP
jgi:uncharacterized surface protein with fasciclin (FAS1) repeats